MSESLQKICVVHLVRKQNGVEPFMRFLNSYRSNSSGMEHDLLVIFKGFEQSDTMEKYLALLKSHPFEAFYVSDAGYDINAYLTTVEQYSERYRYFCFLNSYSIILDQDWLKKMYAHIIRPGVGLVGASGSWNSNFTNALGMLKKRLKVYSNWLRISTNNLVSKFSRKLHFKHKNSDNILLMNDAQKKAARAEEFGRLMRNKNILETLVNLAKAYVPLLIYFKGFPNYHIRTNAFMIEGRLMRSLKFAAPKNKMDSYIFESGRRGLTRRVLDKGLKVVVVGKDGVGYEKEAWNESRVFWRYDQENLLVADNQTMKYQQGTVEERSYFSAVAWNVADNTEKS